MGVSKPFLGWGWGEKSHGVFLWPMFSSFLTYSRLVTIQSLGFQPDNIGVVHLIQLPHDLGFQYWGRLVMASTISRFKDSGSMALTSLEALTISLNSIVNLDMEFVICRQRVNDFSSLAMEMSWAISRVLQSGMDGVQLLFQRLGLGTFGSSLFCLCVV